VLEDLATKEGFQLKTFAVPPPGVEMGAQVLDIAQRYRGEFVISPPVRRRAVGVDQGAQAGRLPAQEGHRPGVGLAEANIEGAGGFGVADGYYVMQFAGVGTDYPVLNEIRRCTRSRASPRRRRWRPRCSTTAACSSARCTSRPSATR
jgi:branched-chain amino acid transport system substrate-binding protein